MPLPRTSRDWVPHDDEYTYAYRHGRWVRLDEPEIDEGALEAWEERRRERIARENEY